MNIKDLSNYSFMAASGALIFFMIGYPWTDTQKAQSAISLAGEIAKVQAEQTPHVIREADGCKVYAFKAGDSTHYFTRCPNATVTTDRSYTVACGTPKAQKQCPKIETIVTGNK
jgi:hypothetical protein